MQQQVATPQFVSCDQTRLPSVLAIGIVSCRMRRTSNVRLGIGRYQDIIALHSSCGVLLQERLDEARALMLVNAFCFSQQLQIETHQLPAFVASRA